VPKYQRNVSGIEDKVISLYARGMSTRDIEEQIRDIYGFSLSAEMVSKITDRIAPEIKEWQQRPLEPIYPFVFMDAIFYKVREDGHILNRAAYVVLGVTVDGKKDILGIWIGENESSKFWLGVMNDLKNRGVKDVLLFCVDGLTGLKDAIYAAYPKAEVQRCIIHQLRNSFKYVSYKDIKAFSKDFKGVYHAINEEIALEKLYEVKDKWGKSYPFAIRSWENNWDVLSSFYKFPEEVRRIIYTTNVIEGLHRQYRKVTKSKTMFPSDSSLEKILYLASMNVMKKWTKRYKNWDQVLSQLLIHYPGRLESYI
jgi:putative transposase